VLVCGSGTVDAAATVPATEARCVETGSAAAGTLAALLAELVDDRVVVLPASPDGRDLAPHLAHRLGRPLLAGAIWVGDHGVSLARGGGLLIEDVTLDAPFVATLVPGVRGVEDTAPQGAPVVLDAPAAASLRADGVDVLDVLPPDLATMDLAEATRILGGGAGLDSPQRFAQAAAIATALGASLGATRVVTDRGWLPHSRQIGTTGAVVDPRLYLAFGISGAVQHTSGLGRPDHIVSVNTDPHCPMMQLADLAIVADANAVLDELQARLGTGDG
jgi:electron transfer flavoprotein alpha subunit